MKLQHFNDDSWYKLKEKYAHSDQYFSSFILFSDMPRRPPSVLLTWNMMIIIWHAVVDIVRLCEKAYIFIFIRYKFDKSYRMRNDLSWIHTNIPNAQNVLRMEKARNKHIWSTIYFYSHIIFCHVATIFDFVTISIWAYTYTWNSRAEAVCILCDAT